MTRIATSTVLLALVVAGTEPCRAQGTSPTNRSTTRGLLLNVHLDAAPGITIKDETDASEVLKTKTGFGAGLQLGYGFTPMFMLFAAIDAAQQDIDDPEATGDFVLAHFDIGGRLSFARATSPLAPYIELALMGRALAATVTDPELGGEADVAFSGGGFAVGAGIQYSFSPKVALDVGARVGFGKFGTLEIDKQEQDLDVKNSMSTRINVGVSFYPMAK
jgi:opacity protein-like surface antigen